MWQLEITCLHVVEFLKIWLIQVNRPISFRVFKMCFGRFWYVLWIIFKKLYKGKELPLVVLVRYIEFNFLYMSKTACFFWKTWNSNAACYSCTMSPVQGQKVQKDSGIFPPYPAIVNIQQCLLCHPEFCDGVTLSLYAPFINTELFHSAKHLYRNVYRQYFTK